MSADSDDHGNWYDYDATPLPCHYDAALPREKSEPRSVDANDSPYRYRYDEGHLPLRGIDPHGDRSKPVFTDPVDARDQFIYDTTSLSRCRPIEPLGMASCYPAITYDAVPRPEPCDEPHVVIEERPTEGR